MICSAKKYSKGLAMFEAEKLTAPNISADEETGIGYRTKEEFIQKFKQFSDSSYQPQKLGGNDFNTHMPWFMYTGMDISDLSAIYTYLRTVKK